MAHTGTPQQASGWRWIWSPWVPFSLLALLAAAGLAAAILLARQNRVETGERDWQPVRNFALQVQQELQRLDSLYQSHLREIATTYYASTARRLANDLPGVLQVSRVDNVIPGRNDWHQQTDAAAGLDLAVPVHMKYDSLLTDNLLFLPPEVLEATETPASGWLNTGPHLAYWHVSGDETRVILIDPEAVGKVIDRWLPRWLPVPARSLELAGGPDRLDGLRGQPILAVAAGGSEAETPEKVQPLLSRFGTWHLSSWAPTRHVVTYNPVVLIVGVGLSLLLLLAGVLVYLHQRSAWKLARQRVSFVNRVSHELRTPLTNILLNAELAEDAAELDPTTTTSRLGLIRREAQRLSRLIDNVLTFSRHEERGAARLHPRPVCPDDVITGVLEQFAPSLEHHGIRVHQAGGAPQRCLLDPDALAQILGNLISNVEKYAQAGGELRLETEQAGGELTVRVADRGPGITPAQARRIFRPFERLNRHVSEGVSGTGLGLTIALDLATRMGGELRLLPQEASAGACFVLRLPAPDYATQREGAR